LAETRDLMLQAIRYNESDEARAWMERAQQQALCAVQDALATFMTPILSPNGDGTLSFERQAGPTLSVEQLFSPA
jgi:hypothetical protein